MVFKTFLAGSGIDGTAVKLTSRVRIPSNNLKIAHQRCTKVQEKFNSIAKLRKKKKKNLEMHFRLNTFLSFFEMYCAVLIKIFSKKNYLCLAEVEVQPNNRHLKMLDAVMGCPMFDH